MQLTGIPGDGGQGERPGSAHRWPPPLVALEDGLCPGDSVGEKLKIMVFVEMFQYLNN